MTQAPEDTTYDANSYDISATQEKWRKVWDGLDFFRAGSAAPGAEKRYALTMFPYPSGDLHMGHAEVMALHDVIARYWWQRGYDVLNPIGWDSFGLPAENAAIRNDANPADWTYAEHRDPGRVVPALRRELRLVAPPAHLRSDYYSWTQWLFLKFRERGLAYRKASPVNWCPNDQTVLANEQVVAGRCERCGAEVTKRELTQWYFKVTDYAQRLLDDMEPLADTWPERVLAMQRNWIGRSEGAHVDFAIEGRAEPVAVFTTRPDTLFGATFFVVAADAKLADELVTDEQRPALAAYVEEVRKATDIERLATDRPKTGVFLGVHATNPVTGWQMPVYASDYVLADYGTGAIMAVPGQDQRDWEFAETFDLPIVRTVQPPADFEGEAYTGAGPAINSANDEISLDGLDVADAKSTIIEWLDGQGSGQGHRQLPAARLAAVPSALLGSPDPDRPLRRLRRGRCAVRRAAREAAPAARRRAEAEGRLAAGRGRGLGQRRVPQLWRSREARHRHDGHVRRLVVVLPALLLAGLRARPVRRGGRARLDAGRPVRRRCRARDPAPAVQPLLHQGHARHGHDRLRRAVHRAAQPGPGDQPGQGDEQVAGQRRQPGRHDRPVRRGRGAADHGLRRPARGRHRLGRHVAVRFAEVPAARLAAERRRRVTGRHAPPTGATCRCAR